MPPVTLARHAMATRFELVLHGPDPRRLRAAGEEALDEIERVERLLSIHRPESELARVNRDAATQPVRVSPEVFELLERTVSLSLRVDGAFDPAAGALIRCWGFHGGTGKFPGGEELQAAREQTGAALLLLDPSDHSVRFRRPGVQLDPGAFGKGYALERAAGFLTDAGVASALLHGGTSTITAIGQPPGEEGWKIAIPWPAPNPGPPRLIGTILLRDTSLSISAPTGKYFRHDGRLLGHVLDPRSGHPAMGTLLSAVTSGSATETDALSTALMVLGPGSLSRVVGCGAGGALIIPAGDDGMAGFTRLGHPFSSMQFFGDGPAGALPG